MLNLLVEARAESRFACAFFTRDLVVIGHFGSREAVTYPGSVFELMSPIDPPSRCVFCGRCPHARKRYRRATPQL